MVRSRRPSVQTTAVVLALAETPTVWRYGYELCQRLGLKAGSMYPILMRLADRGLLETAWETDAPAGRPPRHLHRLTGPGVAMAADLAATATQTAGPIRLRPPFGVIGAAVGNAWQRRLRAREIRDLGPQPEGGTIQL